MSPRSAPRSAAGALLLVSLVAVAACRDPVSSSPVVQRPSVLMAVSAPEITNYRLPLEPITIVFSCADEPIVVSGELHTLVKVWNTSESLRIQGHTNLNLAGIGVSTGRKYRLQQINSTIQEFVQGGPATGQQVFHLHLISQGAASNWYVTMNGTFTFDASGIVFIRQKWETVCR